MAIGFGIKRHNLLHKLQSSSLRFFTTVVRSAIHTLKLSINRSGKSKDVYENLQVNATPADMDDMLRGKREHEIVSEIVRLHRGNTELYKMPLRAKRARFA
jgi:hypothetical protein